jgi:hypothetical protein
MEKELNNLQREAKNYLDSMRSKHSAVLDPVDANHCHSDVCVASTNR